MANDITAFRLPPAEKHALKILAAEADMTLTEYVLHVLRKYTDLKNRADQLASFVPYDEQNPSDLERKVGAA